jgi:hypothetical protein
MSGRYAHEWKIRDAVAARKKELDKKRTFTSRLGIPDGNQCFVLIAPNNMIYTKCSGLENHCPFKVEFDSDSRFCYYHKSREGELEECESSDAIADALKNIKFEIKD